MSDVAKQGKGKSGLSRGVLKVMGLFSGMQIFNILCSIIKQKAIVFIPCNRIMATFAKVTASCKVD